MQVLIRSLIGACLIAQTAAAQGTWRGEQTRRGDTLIVKTIAGSVLRDTLRLVPELSIGTADGPDDLLFGRIPSIDVDKAGNIFVLDAQAFEVRMFSPTGQFIRKFGRRGSGPGEFERPQNLRVTADNRLIVRDQTRFVVFSTEGRYLNGWSLTSGFSTNAPFFLASDLRVLSPIRGAYLWYRIDGTPGDTVRPPSRMPASPMLDVVSPSGNGRAQYSIAYMPHTVWTVTAAGQFISARSDRYEIDVPQTASRVVRIVRDVSAIPVPAAEATRLRDETVASIKRSNNPAFEWNGPPIPKAKPFMDAVFAGTDGTLWVQRTTESVERKVDDPEIVRRTGQSTEWVSSTVYDAFDQQGRLLGVAKFPANAQVYTAPVFSTERIWAVVNHADGYPQIVRYRVQR